VDAFTGRGPYIIAVYNLPAELPRDASAYFGARLLPYVPALARADWTAPFDALALPEELRAATILHRGELTPAYRYLNEPLAKVR
jgi:alpha-aminoadipic semialdehyde synthase